MENNVKFVTYRDFIWGLNNVLMVVFPEGGYIFNKSGGFGINCKDGQIHTDYNVSRAIRQCGLGRWKEITFKEGIKLIDTNGREKVLEFLKKLNIELPAPVEITEEIKNRLIHKLKKKKAFNGDSAYAVPTHKLELYDSLVESGTIRTLDGKHFWLES